ncbi:MAG: hypothetical protein F9K23_09150 [Bacteroidetes bacterium]|nr:MAG: hypothetical protein F9K23_09150 [Bacteroidota bacterium]
MNKYIFLTIVVILLLTACRPKTTDSTDRNSNIDSVYSEISLKYPEKDSLFTYHVTVHHFDDYTVTIETTLKNDSTYLNDLVFQGGNNVVINQQIIFRKKDSVLAVRQLPFDEMNEDEHFINGKNVKLPKYLIVDILATTSKTAQGILYIYSSELNNGSLERSVFYTKEGELLCWFNCSRHSCDTIGNAKALNSYSIDSVNFKSISVFPPQYAGDI